MQSVKLLSLIFLIVGIVSGYLISYATNNQNNSQSIQQEGTSVDELVKLMMENHQHLHNVPHEHGHMHEKFEVSKDKAPSISLVLHKDEKDGWNLQIITENFKFAPENVNKENIVGEGHAHLYIDGDKIGRIYSNWYHLPGSWLSKGKHTIKVDLTTNDHKTYSVDGKEISSEVVITVE